MTTVPDHELEVLEDDQTLPPRPEELVADAGAATPGPGEGVAAAPGPSGPCG